MEQLGLVLANRLAYEAKNFMIHEGVADCITKITALIENATFSIGFVTGAQRSGKTHLSIKSGDMAVNSGLLPRYIEGGDLEKWLQEKFPELVWSQKDIVIIDDADSYLLQRIQGMSGPFVNFIEILRKGGSKVLLFSKCSIEALPCDDHIISRLRPGCGFDIREPDNNDMSKLVQRMGAQRGMLLKERHIEFIVRRIGRSLPAIEQYFDRVMHLSQVLGKKIQYPVLGDAI